MLYRRVKMASTFAGMIRLGIIEDQVTTREVLCPYLSVQPEFCCVLRAASHGEFMAGLAGRADSPPLVLSDIGLLGRSGIEGLAMLRQVLPTADVLLSVHHYIAHVVEALHQGAVGYLKKATPLLKQHLLQVAAGGSPMSPSVAQHVAHHFRQLRSKPLPGLTAHEYNTVHGIEDEQDYELIAARLDLHLNTVRSHIQQLYY